MHACDHLHDIRVIRYVYMYDIQLVNNMYSLSRFIPSGAKFGDIAVDI